jgi:hypothetical protein
MCRSSIVGMKSRERLRGSLVLASGVSFPQFDDDNDDDEDDDAPPGCG